MSDLEKAQRELYSAAVNYAIFDDLADCDRMVSVIARLEVAAERFTDAKRDPIGPAVN